MEMVTCLLCNKPFASGGPKICVRCMKRLDTVYAKARDYLRENPKEHPSLRELGEAIDVDVRDLEILVQEGRLDRDMESGGAFTEDPAEANRKRLLESLQKSLGGDDTKKKTVTYGEERYVRR